MSNNLKTPTAPTIPTVVASGLPRSGTSLLMQMLAAGGLPILADADRPPDADNPRGYFELKDIKSLRDNPAAMNDSPGHAVKVVATQLPYLPTDRPYRILFIHRHLEEVLASQHRMIERLGKSPVPLTDAQLSTALAQHRDAALQWCGRTPQVTCHEFEYRTLCFEPEKIVAEICQFLADDFQLDAQAMASTPDPSLYHQRK